MLYECMKIIPVIILVMLIILPLITMPAYSAAINELNIIIIYDPTVDYGIVVYTLKLDTILSELSMIKIPLIGGNNINIVSVTDSQGEELLYNYDELTNEIDIIANNTDLINITYEVKGLFQEIGIGAYISYIDLSPYNEMNIKAEIDLLGEYTIYAEPNNIDIQLGNALTTITLTTPSQYVIVAEETLATNTTTTTAIRTTTTTITTTILTTTTTTTSIRTMTQPTTTTTTKTEASVEKNMSEKSTTTSNRIETYETTYEEGTSSNTTMWLLAIIVLLIIVAIAMVIKKK